MNKLIQGLQEQGITFYERVDLKHFCTLHIGGPARLVVSVKSIEEIQYVLQNWQGPLLVLGNGSNMLFSDEGYQGVILHLGQKMAQIQAKSTRVYVEAGATNAQLSRFCQQNGLTGYEFASGIPGTVGGAIMMNAGAYFGCTDQVLVEVHYLDEQGRLCVKSVDECELAYRHSWFTDHFGLIVKAVYEFQKGDPQQIQAKIEDLTQRRYAKQPMDRYSAGSTFKRPEGHYASALIQEAGLKGYKVGQASVSQKHSGFLINEKNATAQEFLTLIQEVQAHIWQRYQVKLEPEVKIISPNFNQRSL